MKILYREPSIKMVQFMNGRREAWQRSRPFMEVDDEEMSKVVIADLPVNSFLSYIFEVDSSILFRDLLFTFRGIQPWATSFRQLKSTPENTLMSKEYEDHESELVEVMTEFYKMQSEGVPQDVTKRYLPMATSAQYSVVIDHRSLIAILKTLQESNETLYNIYGKLFMDAAGLTQDDIDASYVKSVLSTLTVDSTDEYLIGHPSGVARAGNHLAGAWKLSGNIMAQVIRMHQATVKNSLWNVVSESDATMDSLVNISCNDQFTVAVYASSEVFERTAITRCAWFGQWDDRSSGWSQIVGSYIKDMSAQEFWDFLSLENGNDKNVANMMGAVQGKEAHPPSPVLLEKPDLVLFRIQKYKSDSVIASKWLALHDEGLINDNPDNEYRKIYEEAIATNGYPE